MTNETSRPPIYVPPAAGEPAQKSLTTAHLQHAVSHSPAQAPAPGPTAPAPAAPAAPAKG
jgi:hypothetical protein